MVKDRPPVTFQVRFVGPGVSPEKVPLRAVSDVLSAVQDLASGRNPFESTRVDPESSIGLVDVKKGSAIYLCSARNPEQAIRNLSRVNYLISGEEEDWETSTDDIEAILPAIRSLSEVSKSHGWKMEISVPGKIRHPLFVISGHEYGDIEKRILMTGESSIYGRIERVGGASGMKCVLRVSNRKPLLYCSIKSREIAQELGKRLYESIHAKGTSQWIQGSGRLVSFEITSFTQP